MSLPILKLVLSEQQLQFICKQLFLSAVKDGTPTDEDLEKLGDKIVEKWKKLGRRLDVTDAKLLEIGQAHDQISEKAYYMLKHWKQEKGSAATYHALCGALKHELVQRKDLAEQFCYINGNYFIFYFNLLNDG